MIQPVSDSNDGTQDQLVLLRSAEMEHLVWPKEELREAEDGAVGNRRYSDMRGFTWKDARRALQFEEATLSRFSWNLKAADRSLTDQDRFERLHFLDLGVASSVLALSAARCAPVSSCSGAVGHSEAHPLVAFFTRKQRVPNLLAVAADVECGLQNSRGGSVVVYAESVATLLGFARKLIEKRSTLAPLRAHRRVPSTDYRQLRLSLDV